MIFSLITLPTTTLTLTVKITVHYNGELKIIYSIIFITMWFKKYLFHQNCTLKSDMKMKYI